VTQNLTPCSLTPKEQCSAHGVAFPSGPKLVGRITFSSPCASRASQALPLAKSSRHGRQLYHARRPRRRVPEEALHVVGWGASVPAMPAHCPLCDRARTPCAYKPRPVLNPTPHRRRTMGRERGRCPPLLNSKTRNPEPVTPSTKPYTPNPKP